MQDVERPVLDSSRASPVLHLAETGYSGPVEGNRFAVEYHLVIGQIGCQSLELRVFVGDVATAPRAQVELASVRVDQDAIAVPLALEHPLRCLEFLNRSLGRQHRCEIACLRAL